MRRIQNILAWVLTVLLGLVFLAAGAAKLAGTQQMVQTFAQIGFGQWLRYVTGLCEVGGAIGIFVSRLRFLAALLLGCVMVGATLTNLVILHLQPAAVLTLVLLALALVLAWLRSPGKGTSGQDQTLRTSA